MLRKSAIIALGLIAASTAPVGAATDVGVGVNINIGTPPPPPVVVAPPPAVVVTGPPVFVMPPSLGFYVAVGIPYDIFYVSGQYYLYQGNNWYRAPYYNGPWGAVKYQHLPPGLRNHSYDRIVQYRDQEYRVYRDEQDHYRGKHFKPGKEWKKEQNREKEEKKEHNKHGKHGD